MPSRKPSGKAGRLVEDLRGATRLAVEATRGVTDLVDAMHLLPLPAALRCHAIAARKEVHARLRAWLER